MAPEMGPLGERKRSGVRAGWGPLRTPPPGSPSSGGGQPRLSLASTVQGGPRPTLLCLRVRPHVWEERTSLRAALLGAGGARGWPPDSPKSFPTSPGACLLGAWGTTRGDLPLRLRQAGGNSPPLSPPGSEVGSTRQGSESGPSAQPGNQPGPDLDGPLRLGHA